MLKEFFLKKNEIDIKFGYECSKILNKIKLFLLIFSTQVELRLIFHIKLILLYN